MTHQVAFFLRVEHALRLCPQCTVHPWGRGRTNFDVELDRGRLPLAREGATYLRLHGGGNRLTPHSQAQVPERLDHLEGERSGTEDTGFPIGSQRVVDRTRTEDVEHATAGLFREEEDISDAELFGTPKM